MNYIGRILALGGALALTTIAGSANAFEIEGTSSVSPASLGLQQELAPGDVRTYSLAMPMSSKSDTFSEAATAMSYGNAIAIPAPGIDRPTPAWASSPLMGVLGTH